MTFKFGIGLPKDQPLTVETAVRRGHLFITVPVVLIILALGFPAWVLLKPPSNPSTVATLLLVLWMVAGPPGVAWLWWSYTVPRWRHWALKQGVDADALQRRAVAQNLVWPRGHFFERTEFRDKGDDD
jgi:hypothetical protein